MTIFLNNIKRLFRDKFTFITMLILPVIFISFAMFALGNNSSLKVAVLDEDRTRFTSMLVSGIKSSANVEEMEEKDLKQGLINDKIDYGVRIPAGFTKALIQRKNAKVETFHLEENDAAITMRFYIDSFINASKNIALAANGREAEFYRGMDLYLSNHLKAEFLNVENTEKDSKIKTYYSLGFLIMFMLYMSVNAATLVLEDKQLKTYGRILSSPVTTRNYFAQNLLSYIAVMLLQVYGIFIILIFVFKADMGPSIGNLLVLFSVFALTAVALGVAISSFAKAIRQANALAYLVTLPMCMLGGCFWPREIMPRALQQLANFTPVTWVLKASEKLLYGGNIGSITSEIIILLLFALVFLIAGSNRRVMKSGAN